MSNIRHLVRGLAAGVVACACVLPVCAAEDAASVDPDTVPRAVGGGSTLGGSASISVIPYALPEIPEDAVEGKKTLWGAPDLSGIYGHRARLFQNPWPSTGVGPGIATAPSALTLHPELDTDRLGSWGDYRTPLLRPWAAELVKQLGDAEAANQPYFERCVRNHGLLLAWARDPAGKRGIQFLQTPNRMYIFFAQDVLRIIYLNAEHPADLELSVNGHSIGHWEDDTLVVDTIGFDGTSEGDRYGTPTSEQMHVVERMSLRHGGQILEISFWVDDPFVYTQSWTSVVTYARADKVGGEYVCQETRLYPPPY